MVGWESDGRIVPVPELVGAAGSAKSAVGAPAVARITAHTATGDEICMCGLRRLALAKSTDTTIFQSSLPVLRVLSEEAREECALRGR